ncbi:MAG: FliH/SctL family protein [Heliobacteriaceae bacterium]|nr:FliH/SctL family protein [Heliobacteriaceae bacterium]MDD4587069.1 FliH/SctL family protein [Heliobacteriaceae bacterium]
MSSVIKLPFVEQQKTVFRVASITEEAPTLDPEPVLNGLTDVESAQAQADRILEETRVAVCDLLEKAREQAALIAATAREEAAGIREKAEAMAAELKHQQADCGYQAGYEQGIADAQTQGEAIIAAARQEAEAARQAKLAYINGQEKELVELAVLIAEKILQFEIANKPDVVVKIALNALNKVRNMGEVVIKVNSQDFGLVQAVKPELMSMIKGLHTLAIEKDDSISPGGCIVDTGHGYVDARIDAQLVEVRRVIAEVMNR